MVKESWDLGIPLFSNQRARMAGPGLLGFKIKRMAGRSSGHYRFIPAFVYQLKMIPTAYDAGIKSAALVRTAAKPSLFLPPAVA